ncbi:MAG TPA: hypothetical protein VGI75_01965 [Pirellulales bacterium]|jgi:hypothetical protein
MAGNLSRRDFHQLTSAAIGGILAGSLTGCSGDGAKEAKAADAELHACRGLNDCKGQGADKQNACAGQGSCASVKHSCSGQNDCKHQGGCGESPGMNDCKTKGGCEVPMNADMWAKARAQFEDRMKKAGKTIGEAPAAKESKS